MGLADPYTDRSHDTQTEAGGLYMSNSADAAREDGCFLGYPCATSIGQDPKVREGEYLHAVAQQ